MGRPRKEGFAKNYDGKEKEEWGITCCNGRKGYNGKSKGWRGRGKNIEKENDELKGKEGTKRKLWEGWKEKKKNYFCCKCEQKKS